jgi:hypothetical protein
MKLGFGVQPLEGAQGDRQTEFDFNRLWETQRLCWRDPAGALVLPDQAHQGGI